VVSTFHTERVPVSLSDSAKSVKGSLTQS
jgi:hypothetical protein